MVTEKEGTAIGRRGVRMYLSGDLEALSARLFQAAGTDADIAHEVATHLVRSDLSGHHSHGVIRVPQYIGRIESGELRPNARPTVLIDNETTAVIDAHRGFGHVATDFALDWAMERVSKHGIAAAAVRHCTHMGRLGEFTERAAGRGLIAILTVGAAGPGIGGMFAYGGRERFLGANPWSFGIPGNGTTMMVDASSSTIAEGKVRVARSAHERLQLGTIYDASGRMSTDPEDFYAGGGLVPLGGAEAGHKGYGLAFASALLGGLCMIGDADPTTIGASIQPGYDDASGHIAGVFLIAIDPGRFGDAQRYREMVGETLDAVKRSKPAEGMSEVLIPGEPEARSRQSLSGAGFSLSDSLRSEFEALAARYGVDLPKSWNS